MLKKKKNNRKGFTLIELIVVMAILAILVLLAAPRFIGQTNEAQFTKHINNAKVMEDAAERYYIDHGKWPRGGDEEVYTPEEISAYAERIYDITGEEITLNEGDYWDIDYTALASYAKLPSEDERANYVLRNPVGKVFYLEGLTPTGANRMGADTLSEPIETPPESARELTNAEINALPYDQWVDALEAKGYVMATDADFTKVTYQYVSKGYHWRYIGTDDHVILPQTIGGVAVTDAYRMFDVGASQTVQGVAVRNPELTDMRYMFSNSQATSLDLSAFNTANVTTMGNMFYGSQATTLDLSSFDTAKVTDMYAMFNSSQATTLDLSGFDTANVTNMRSMFTSNQATMLDLSGFDTANVTTMTSMFNNSQATTLDLRNFDTANVTDMSGMFVNSKATTLDLSSFDLSKIVTGTTSTTSKNWYMFYNSAARTGYARTAADAMKLNHTDTSRPTGLKFIVQP